MVGELRVVVEDLAPELASIEGAICSHPFLAGLEAGAVTTDQLRAFACEQQYVLSSDQRSFVQLAARYPHDPAGPFFLAMAGGEGEALGRLGSFSAALGLSVADVAAYEPRPGCQSYPAFVAWLAVNGTRLDVTLAFLVNLDAWGANCARMRQALQQVYDLPSEALGFFDFFASPPSGLRGEIEAVATAGLRAGDSPVAARRAVRLLQAYELAFWDTLAEAGS